MEMAVFNRDDLNPLLLSALAVVLSVFVFLSSRNQDQEAADQYKAYTDKYDQEIAARLEALNSLKGFRDALFIGRWYCDGSSFPSFPDCVIPDGCHGAKENRDARQQFGHLDGGISFAFEHQGDVVHNACSSYYYSNTFDEIHTALPSSEGTSVAPPCAN
jgi:hypothetical protein